MKANVMLGIAVLAGCATVAREGEEYNATDTLTKSADTNAYEKCRSAGLAVQRLRKFSLYNPVQQRNTDRLYFTCVKPGQERYIPGPGL